MFVVSGKIRKNEELIIRKIALTMDQVAVMETPVDTGRARANWFVFIGTPQEAETGAPSDPGGAASSALAQGAAAIAGYKLGMGTIFIVNNVEYIIPLDQGSSAQAPAGMSVAAIQAGREVAARAQLLAGV